VQPPDLRERVADAHECLRPRRDRHGQWSQAAVGEMPAKQGLVGEAEQRTAQRAIDQERIVRVLDGGERGHESV
jgi:hypothetical protein